MNQNTLKPLTKEEFLNTLDGNIITSAELDKLYHDYLTKFYGYNN